MKNKTHLLLGCYIFAALCFFFVSYSHLYEGKREQGLTFLLLAISQLLLAIGKFNKAETIEKKNLFIILLLVMAVGFCVAAGCSYFRKEFTGNRIKNPDSYIAEIEKMNGKDQHTLELMKGDVLIVHNSVDKGTLTLELTGPEGQIVFIGNEKNNVDEFKVNVLESGKYTIAVEAHHATGMISVIKQTKE